MLLPFCLEFYRWQNGRTQFAPTVGFLNIVLKSSPQQTPPLPKGRGTVEDGGGILEFNWWQKKGNPRRGFPSCTSCNSPILRKMEQKRVSLSAESDQRRRLWNPPPFEKGGPKLYYLVWNLTGGKKQQYCRAGACSCRFVWDYIIEKTGERSSPLRLGFLSLILKSAPQQTPSPLRRRGTAPAVDEVVELNGW